MHLTIREVKELAKKLLVDVEEAKNHKKAISVVEQFVWHLIQDRRAKVTDELRKKVIAMDKNEMKITDMMHESGLSAPTIRKIIREA